MTIEPFELYDIEYDLAELEPADWDWTRRAIRWHLSTPYAIAEDRVRRGHGESGLVLGTTAFGLDRRSALPPPPNAPTNCTASDCARCAMRWSKRAALPSARWWPRTSACALRVARLHRRGRLRALRRW